MAPEPRESLRLRDVILTSWASVSTALLLFVVIGGAVYLHDVRTRCDNHDGDDDIKSSHIYDRDGKEDIYMRKQDETQLYIKRNKEGGIILISHVDYGKKVCATYIAQTDQCYLTAGSNMDWDAAWNNPKPQNAGRNISESSATEERWEVDLSSRVTDASVLHKYIRPFCEDKQIYWMVPSDEESREVVGDRVKRSTWYFCVAFHQYCHSTNANEWGNMCYHYIYSSTTGWFLHYISFRCDGNTVNGLEYIGNQ